MLSIITRHFLQYFNMILKELVTLERLCIRRIYVMTHHSPGSRISFPNNGACTAPWWFEADSGHVAWRWQAGWPPCRVAVAGKLATMSRGGGRQAGYHVAWRRQAGWPPCQAAVDGRGTPLQCRLAVVGRGAAMSGGDGSQGHPYVGCGGSRQEDRNI